jgi:aminoglycoside phosphotransferase (APT) family kinase protein
MQAAQGRRARDAAMSAASALGLSVDDAVVLSDSNRMVLRLVPCDVVARVAAVGYGATMAAVGVERELELVRQLAGAGAPVATPEARVEPRVIVRDGFDISLWTYFQPLVGRPLEAIEYARALERLHEAMRSVDAPVPHFTERIADTRRWAAQREVTPDLLDDDRDLLVGTMDDLLRSIVHRGATEQLLHGEPHPWNVLLTDEGPLFFDFENAVRGPVEFDLAWVPGDVSAQHRGVDHQLLDECRGVVLAMIAAHRWHRDDQHPAGQASGVAFLDAVRAGSPWPPLETV